jgi:hypothetical protein
VAGVDEIPETEIKNRNAPVGVMTDEPVTDSGRAGCPTANWTEDINDVAVTRAKIGVFQPEALVPAVDCNQPALRGRAGSRRNLS